MRLFQLIINLWFGLAGTRPRVGMTPGVTVGVRVIIGSVGAGRRIR